MAEEIQDMEMEDILSSIKNILEEDEQKQSPEMVPGSDVVDDILNSDDTEVDDILELSPDMRVAETGADSVKEEQTEVSVEEVKDIESDAGDINIGIVDDESDSVFEETFGNSFVGINEDPVVDQIVEPVTESFVTDNISKVSMPKIETETAVVEPEHSPDELLSLDAIMNESQAEQKMVNDEQIFETETIDEEENTVEGEKNTAVEVEETTVETPKSQEVSSPLDVSAGIISNFAKMFSKDDSTQKSTEEKVSEPKITYAGDTSKTLEDFVLDAVIRAVGKEISHQWNDGAEYKSFAEAEIVRQTEKWINENLPTIVEKVVKQEIERVIAKVGS